MKNFIDHIVSKVVRDNRISQLKKLKILPVILYGSGLYAKELARFLNSISIKVSDYLVDDEYVNKITAGDVKPCSMAEIENRYKEIHLILAYCGNPAYAVKKLNRRRSRTINSIQIIDCRFWERFRSLNFEQVNVYKAEYQRIFEWFQDDLSRKTYTEYINAKLLYDSSNLRELLSDRQYFPDNLPQFAPSDSDVFIDGGAFTGDTLEDVMAMTGGRGCTQYYAFEPDACNAEKLRSFVNSQHLDFVSIIERGLWSGTSILCFSSNDGSRSTVSTNGDEEIKVDAIDRFDIPATFIKMDIEGSEYEALVGARKTIRKHQPNLAIAMYHKPEDLLQIPLYIKSLCPDYRLYLRIHSYYSEELVLYATVRD